MYALDFRYIGNDLKSRRSHTKKPGQNWTSGSSRPGTPIFEVLFAPTLRDCGLGNNDTIITRMPKTSSFGLEVYYTSIPVQIGQELTLIQKK